MGGSEVGSMMLCGYDMCRADVLDSVCLTCRGVWIFCVCAMVG